MAVPAVAKAFAGWLLALASPVLVFAPAALAQYPLADSFNPAPDGRVDALALGADGKILVGANFSRLSGQTCNKVGRLNADGTFDSSFNAGWVDAYVSCLALQPDGRILVGGGFTNLGGQARMTIGRLNADGTVDSDFNSGADGSVLALVPQPTGVSWWAATSGFWAVKLAITSAG